METVKKARTYRRTGITQLTSAGHPVSAELRKRRRWEKVWDVQWYNFLDEKWEREGERLEYRQAYARAYDQRKSNPYAKIGLVLLTGARPKNRNNTDAPQEIVDAGSNA